MQDDDDETREIDPRVLEVPSLLPGDRCKTIAAGDLARVVFVGNIDGMPRGYWVGVVYDEKVGRNDGSLLGRRYFRCPQGFGGFVRCTRLSKVVVEEANSKPSGAGAYKGRRGAACSPSG